MNIKFLDNVIIYSCLGLAQLYIYFFVINRPLQETSPRVETCGANAGEPYLPVTHLDYRQHICFGAIQRLCPYCYKMQNIENSCRNSIHLQNLLSQDIPPILKHLQLLNITITNNKGLLYIC